jgi:hypothetical protein
MRKGIGLFALFASLRDTMISMRSQTRFIRGVTTNRNNRVANP